MQLGHFCSTNVNFDYQRQRRKRENTEQLQQKMLQRGAHHAGIPTSLTEEEGGGGPFWPPPFSAASPLIVLQICCCILLARVSWALPVQSERIVNPGHVWFVDRSVHVLKKTPSYCLIWTSASDEEVALPCGHSPTHMSGFMPESILTGPAASNCPPPARQKKKTWWLFLIRYLNQWLGEETLISVMHLKSMLWASSELL